MTTEPARSHLRVFVALGAALGAACVRAPVKVPPPVSPPTAFSVADYRRLGPVERMDRLARIETGRLTATDADLVAAYRLETTPGRRSELVDLLRHRHTPERDRAVLAGLDPWDGRSLRSEIATALTDPQTRAARAALTKLTKDRDASVRWRAYRALYRRRSPEEIRHTAQMMRLGPSGFR